MRTWGFFNPHVQTFKNQNFTGGPLTEFDLLLDENAPGSREFAYYIRKFEEKKILSLL